MKAAVLTAFGPEAPFQIQEVAIPEPAPGELLVKVMASSVNPIDYQIRRGDYTSQVNLPAIIGHDVSGEVVAVGTGVSRFQPGDQVYYSPPVFGKQGSFAQYHTVRESVVALKPSNISHLEAATLPLAAGTAWDMLVTRAGLQLNQTILVHGGAGGVGSMTIQLAKAIGAKVFTTAGAYHKETLLNLGADHVIDYRSENYLDAVNDLTNGKGVDVVIDTIGGATLAESPAILADYGKVVSIVDISIPQNLILAWQKNATYHFVFTAQDSVKLNELATLVEHGKLKPVTGSIFELKDITEAHNALERKGKYTNKTHLGKIAIAIQ
jgi:NADPH:quinone reductase-like Zn-dependent oxidoreductase